MSFGLLFSGQGTQHPQMLSWVDDDDEIVAQTEATLQVADWRAALRDPEWAARNRNAQVLLTGIGLSAWRRIAARLPPPAAVAGYSVGELAAFSAAGVFGAATAVELAARRAEAMDRCAAASPGGLLAVTGLSAASIEEACVDAEVSVAILIDVDACILGGPRPALSKASERALARGAKCTLLNVGVASHTPAMQSAADDFGNVLRALALRAPDLPLFGNAAADRVWDADHAARTLATQMSHTVQWAGCLDALHARRPACVLEVGPGSALATMWNKRHPDVPARSADEFRSARAVQDWVLRHVVR